MLHLYSQNYNRSKDKEIKHKISKGYAMQGFTNEKGDFYKTGIFKTDQAIALSSSDLFEFLKNISPTNDNQCNFQDMNLRCYREGVKNTLRGGVYQIYGKMRKK